MNALARAIPAHPSIKQQRKPHKPSQLFGSILQKIMRHLLFVLTLLLLCSCMDQDPFGLSTRDIVGPYELHQWEDGKTYYLEGPSHVKGNGHGAIEGIVTKLGWNNNYILVYQNDDGQGGGWRIVDVQKKTISEIIDQARIDQDAMLKGLTIYDASEAWKKLK